MNLWKGLGILQLAFLAGVSAKAEMIETNSVRIPNPPSWLTPSRVERVTDKIEKILEWPIRRANVVWYTQQSEFEKIHGYGPSVLAFARKADNSIHVGPRIDANRFDSVFGHELVHVIIYQKFKTAIPQWLEEGLASYLSGEKRVDYKWLSKQPRVKVASMSHPFKGKIDSQVHYQMSTALIEFIASKCDLNDLLQLAVGKSLTNYLSTYCEISDMDSGFGEFLKRKATAIR